jgi:hypothetical protein
MNAAAHPIAGLPFGFLPRGRGMIIECMPSKAGWPALLPACSSHGPAAGPQAIEALSPAPRDAPRQVVNIITRTSHYESCTMSGTGYILSATPRGRG